MTKIAKVTYKKKNIEDGEESSHVECWIHHCKIPE